MSQFLSFWKYFDQKITYNFTQYLDVFKLAIKFFKLRNYKNTFQFHSFCEETNAYMCEVVLEIKTIWTSPFGIPFEWNSLDFECGIRIFWVFYILI